MVTHGEPVDGVKIDGPLWLAWLINRRTLAVQAWLLDLTAPPSSSGCACPGCAPHEQDEPPADRQRPRQCEQQP